MANFRKHCPMAALTERNIFMKNRTRKIPIQVYLNEDEYFILNKKLELSNMRDTSKFIRHLILYGYVYDVDYSYLQEFNALLGRISSSLNQIAKRVNSTNNFYQDDMEQIKKEIDEIWRIQKSILSRQPSIKQ